VPFFIFLARSISLKMGSNFGHFIFLERKNIPKTGILKHIFKRILRKIKKIFEENFEENKFLLRFLKNISPFLSELHLDFMSWVTLIL